MEQKKNRNIVFDLLKLFAIFLVLWGHVIQQFTILPGVENKTYQIIYSFHMPLFMMISGYFAVSIIKKGFWEVVWQKVQQLIIPATVGGVVIGLLLVYFESQFSVLQIPKFLFGCLWFLKSAFICTLFYWIGAKIIPTHQWIGLLVTLLISQLINIFSIRFMYPSFLLGVWIRQNYDFFQKYRKSITIVSGFLWLVLVLSFTSDTYKAQWGGYFVSSTINSASLVHIYHRFITGLCGAVFYIGLFEIIFSKISSPVVSRASKIGQYTLGIYILQSIILETIFSRIIHVRSSETFFLDMVVAPLGSIIILILCLVIVKFVKKYRIGRIMLLGERIRRPK
ncbi:MAG: acyltransferase family protein [Bacteroidales bacterium]|nr:acyltransferase family protein [Bacteroidales bacterium]